jgi:hypothetical protein
MEDQSDHRMRSSERSDTQPSAAQTGPVYANPVHGSSVYANPVYANPAAAGNQLRDYLEPRKSDEQYRKHITKQIEAALSGMRKSERQARRYTLAVTFLSFVAAVMAAFTVSSKRPTLAAIPAVASATVVGLSSWSEKRNLLGLAKAHRIFATKATRELRLFDACVPPYNGSDKLQWFVSKCEDVGSDAYAGIDYVL